MSTVEEQWVEGIDKQVSDWYRGMQKRLKAQPPLGAEKLDDLAFYEKHRQKAEFWQSQGDPNYMVALATVAPEEAERFIKVARRIAAEEAVRNYGN